MSIRGRIKQKITADKDTEALQQQAMSDVMKDPRVKKALKEAILSGDKTELKELIVNIMQAVNTKFMVAKLLNQRRFYRGL